MKIFTIKFIRKLVLFFTIFFSENVLLLKKNEPLKLLDINKPLNVTKTMELLKSKKSLLVNKQQFMQESIWLRSYNLNYLKANENKELKLSTILKGNLKGSIEKTKDIFYKLNQNNLNDPIFVKHILLKIYNI